MKNCFILGFGRSGTSLMGGILHQSGYFLGDDLYPPRESNPKGFFENDVINGINERILAEYDHIKIRKTSEPITYNSSPYNPSYGQRWLTYIPTDVAIDCKNDSILSEIKHVLSFPNFAYKDPRFNYTLPVWDRFLHADCVKICMFRDPGATVESVVKDWKTAIYMVDFYIDREIIYNLWYNSYQRVLNYLASDKNGEIIFVHYEQLLSGLILPELSGKLGVKLDDRFISTELNRSHSVDSIPLHVQDLYESLCQLSGYRNDIVSKGK